MNARYDMKIPSGEFPYLQFKECAIYLKRTFGQQEVKAEYRVSHGWVNGVCDLIWGRTVVELKAVKEVKKEHMYQVMMYTACLDEDIDSYIYNLSDGSLIKIWSSENRLLWRYMVGAYGTIKNHVDIVTDRQNRLVDRGYKLPSIGSDIYCVDTEYTRSNNVFDFAMINVRDPFKSIVQPLNPTQSIASLSTFLQLKIDPPKSIILQPFNPNIAFYEIDFAVGWMGDHMKGWSRAQLRKLLLGARSNLDNCFIEISGTVLYFSAATDKIIPQKYGMETYDLKDKLNELAKQKGSSTEHNFSVNLGELYDVVIEPLELQEHLNQHTALTDALILYELLSSGYITYNFYINEN